jgi:hypothetical protein
LVNIQYAGQNRFCPCNPLFSHKKPPEHEKFSIILPPPTLYDGDGFVL